MISFQNDIVESNDSSTKTWTEFTDSTTFHGIRNIFDPKHSPLRRFFWTLIMLGVLGLFTFQIVSRGIDFGQRELSVSVEVKYTDRLPYPTVTICNQNRYS